MENPWRDEADDAERLADRVGERARRRQRLAVHAEAFAGVLSEAMPFITSPRASLRILPFAGQRFAMS
jgi:hypothetical protein